MCKQKRNNFEVIFNTVRQKLLHVSEEMCTFPDNSELFFFYSYVFIREPLAKAFLILALRDCPRWIIANVSRERGDTSKMLSLAPRFCIRRMLLMNFSRASSWEILRTNDKSSYLRRHETRRVSRGKRKKRKSTEYGNACYGDSSGFRCLRPIEISAPRSSDIPRELSRGIPSRGGLRNVDSSEVTQKDGNISRITVGWGTLGISREILCLEHFVSDEIIFKQPDGPFSVLSLSLESSSSFYVSLRRAKKIENVSAALANLSSLFFMQYMSKNHNHVVNPSATDDRC